MKAIKTIIKHMVYDEDLVHSSKQVKLNKDQLYTYLISGKISLKEYLSLV